MKNAPSPKSPANIKVPKASTSDTSASRSPTISSVNYDAYSSIDHVIRELHICTLSFQYPHDLDFEVSRSGPESVPKLTYTPKNRSFLEQVRKLEGLQEKLDSIDSRGDEDVRQARKETGALVERALADMEWAKAVVWDKVSVTLKALRYRMVSDNDLGCLSIRRLVPCRFFMPEASLIDANRRLRKTAPQIVLKIQMSPV